MKNIYIQSNSCISAQETFDTQKFLEDINQPSQGKLSAISPNFREIIPAKWSRRMSLIIKIAIATALDCLNKSEVKSLCAIITGTGLGCLEDTEKFLASIHANEENLLSPTPFIQSTHNTISGQLALMLQSYNYNYTYSQKGFSFENAFDDALIHLEEGEDEILVGGFDELTASSHKIISDLNCHPEFADGEGASFFLLGHQKNENYLARVAGFKMVYHPNKPAEIQREILSMINEANISLKEIDVLLLGSNLNPNTDKWYNSVMMDLDKASAIAGYKHLFGEFHTVSALGLSLACRMLKENKIFPPTKVKSGLNENLKYILVYNHYQEKNHSIYLIARD